AFDHDLAGTTIVQRVARELYRRSVEPCLCVAQLQLPEASRKYGQGSLGPCPCGVALVGCHRNRFTPSMTRSETPRSPCLERRLGFAQSGLKAWLSLPAASAPSPSGIPSPHPRNPAAW